MNNRDVASPLVGDAWVICAGVTQPPSAGVHSGGALCHIQLLALCVAVFGAVVGGCQLMVNPFHDELAGPQQMTTPSVEGARAATAAPSLRQRGYAPVEIHAENGAVTHGPLYFEDPFEDKGSEDGQFAWTGEDYLQAAYWRGRFLVNTLLFPISAIVTPPWTVMESDGHLSRQALGMDHDAQRAAEASSAAPPHHDEGAAAQAGG
ncbi:MAG: hypothetical protein V1790_08700 [Planctomycetota bacterium]